MLPADLLAFRKSEELLTNFSSEQTVLPQSKKESPVLRRSFRRVLQVTYALDVQIRIIGTVSTKGKWEKIMLSVELANNSATHMLFSVESVEVSIADSIKGIQPLQASKMLLLAPYDQHNLLFSITIEADTPRVSPTPVLPPTTPLAALLTPSQVFTISRSFDPRVGASAKGENAPAPESQKSIRVTVTGHPIYPQPIDPGHDDLPTHSFTSTWECLLKNEDYLSSGLAQKSRRRAGSILAAPAAMAKAATSIGLRSSLVAMPINTSTTKSPPYANAAMSHMPAVVQATAGSKRHSVSGLLKVSQSMAANFPPFVDRTSLARQNSRQSAPTLTEAGQPKSLQLPPTADLESTPSYARGALPPHMSEQARPRASPRRSMSAFAVPTLGSSLSSNADATNSIVFQSLSSAPSEEILERPPLSPLTASTGLKPVRSISGPQHGAASPRHVARRTLVDFGAPRQPSAVSPNHTVPAPSPKIDGQIVVSISLMAPEELVSDIRPAANAEDGGEAKGGEDDAEVLQRSRLRNFKLDSPSQEPSPLDTSIIADTESKPAIHVFDVFIVEMFVINQSNHTCSLVVRIPVIPGESGPPSILPLDSDISIGWGLPHLFRQQHDFS